MTRAHSLKVLSADVWRGCAEVHRARAERHTVPARQRRDRGVPHPVADFLFEYYPFPFSLLEKWHPGLGYGLERANSGVWLKPPFADRWHVLADGIMHAEPRRLNAKDLQRIERMAELLEATRDRPPNFACHGLHEWAMVFRGKQVRHEQTLKLRLPQTEIDEIVESRPVCCSHHDAFRFFAAEARPLNRLQPNLDSRLQHEQPGCLHANMDLYKWAAKTMPWAGSGLLLDCFELAADVRNLDMRASPYDLSEWGLAPVRIESAEGRLAYEIEQKEFSVRAGPLRARLIDVLRRTLEAAAG